MHEADSGGHPIAILAYRIVGLHLFGAGFNVLGLRLAEKFHLELQGVAYEGIVLVVAQPDSFPKKHLIVDKPLDLAAQFPGRRLPLPQLEPART